MKIAKFKNLYQFTFLPYLFPINSYLYEEKDYFILIDIGTKYFIKYINKLINRKGKQIRYVILTHPHQDHIGGLDDLMDYYKYPKVCISKRDNRLLNCDFTVDKEEAQKKINGGFKTVETIPDISLEDGMKVGSLLIINTKGHTPGSISLYDSESKILIAGDALQTQGGIAIAGDRKRIFPFPALATWSLEESVKSIKKLINLDIECLATGHGKLIYYPKDRIIKSLTKIERKLKNEKENIK